MNKLLHKILCLIGHHEEYFIDELSDQAWLIGCRVCDKKWALKVKGEYQGSRLPWTDTHRQFYKLLGYKGEH